MFKRLMRAHLLLTKLIALGVGVFWLLAFISSLGPHALTIGILILIYVLFVMYVVRNPNSI